jgi:hypothetical protein
MGVSKTLLRIDYFLKSIAIISYFLIKT